MSSNSESDDVFIDDIAYNDDDDGLSDSHRQPNQHQHQRYHEVHSDVSGTLSSYIETLLGTALQAVAIFVLERGAVRLQDAIGAYHSAGGDAHQNSNRLFEHFLRHLPLSAFSGARKAG